MAMILAALAPLLIASAVVGDTIPGAVTGLSDAAAGKAAPHAIASFTGGFRDYFNADRSFTLYEENDIFQSDVSYTQGLRLTWTFAKWDTGFWGAAHRLLALAPANLLSFVLSGRRISLQAPGFACPSGNYRPRVNGAIVSCGIVGYGLGHTIHTPDTLRTPELQPGDRPYAGHLVIQRAGTTVHGQTIVTSELSLGMTGAPSLAAAAQRMAHWALVPEAARPAGWHHQLNAGPQVGLRNEYARIVRERCVDPFSNSVLPNCSGDLDEGRVGDVLLRTEWMLGTLFRRASVGATLRIGRGFPMLAATQRIPATRLLAATTLQQDTSAPGVAPQTVARTSGGGFWWMVFASGDLRYVQHNGLIEGTYLDEGAGEWREVMRITPNWGVVEGGIGATVGILDGALAAQWIIRSPEFEETGWHRYLTITLTINGFER